jgi:hypothetical protein
MNERIRKLADEAGWLDDKQFASWNKLHQWQNFDKEKFAELIVRECIKICSDVEADTEMDLSDGALVCMSEIKEHFGVNE